MDKFGTDALRFAMSTGTSPGNDIKMSLAKVEAGRNFANKLWNATRFVVKSIQDAGSIHLAVRTGAAAVEERWIMSRLARTAADVNAMMTDYQFGEALTRVYEFLWGEFCDWYVEFAKIRLRAGDASPLPVLANSLETALRLLHPYMPFVTEELWQSLKRAMPAGWQSAESIMIAPYPVPDASRLDPEAERVMAAVIDIIHAVRNVRAEHHVDAGKWVAAQVYAGGLSADVRAFTAAIEGLSRARPVEFLEGHHEGPCSNALMLVLKESEVVIPLESIVDLAAERARLDKEMEQCRAAIAATEARLGDENFRQRAPAAVVAKEQDKLAAARDRLNRLQESRDKLS